MVEKRERLVNIALSEKVWIALKEVQLTLLSGKSLDLTLGDTVGFLIEEFRGD